MRQASVALLLVAGLVGACGERGTKEEGRAAPAAPAQQAASQPTEPAPEAPAVAAGLQRWLAQELAHLSLRVSVSEVPAPARVTPGAPRSSWLLRSDQPVRLAELHLDVLHAGADTFATSEAQKIEVVVGPRTRRAVVPEGWTPPSPQAELEVAHPRFRVRVRPGGADPTPRASRRNLSPESLRSVLVADLQQVLDLDQLLDWLHKASGWSTWVEQDGLHASATLRPGSVRPGGVRRISIDARLDADGALKSLRIEVRRARDARPLVVMGEEGGWAPSAAAWGDPFPVGAPLQHPHELPRPLLTEGWPLPVEPDEVVELFELTPASSPPSPELLALKARHMAK